MGCVLKLGEWSTFDLDKVEIRPRIKRLKGVPQTMENHRKTPEWMVYFMENPLENA